MRPCIPRDAPHAPPMEKQGLDLSTGSGFSGLSGHQLSGLHAVSSLAQLAPLGGPLPLGAGSPFGSRAVDPAAATLNLSLNLPLSQSPHQLREILLAQLIRGVAGFAGIIQPAGPVISSLGPPKSRGATPPPAPPAPLLTDAEADAAHAASSSAPSAAPSTTATSSGSAPPYRYPAAYGAHAPQYYSPYPQQYYPPPYQDPCYPANYYHRALHYRRHYTYLAPSGPALGPALGPPPDPYAAAGSPLAVAPPVGAVHQMQMVVSSGPPPGAPPAHANPPEYPVEPYVHYPAYPASETATYRCPCPMQSCPKNVHTGPLTGDSKGPKMQPLPPVALALPHEPPGLTPGGLGPPSPARGSAGMPPPPSPAAGATHRYHAWDNMESAKSVVKQDPGTPPDGTPGGTPPARTPPGPAGLLAISKHDSPPAPAALGPPPPVTPVGAARRKRDRPVKGPQGTTKEDAVKLEDLKDVKQDVKQDAKAVTTTIEEATQTSPPPEAAKAAQPAGADANNGQRSPSEKRTAPEDLTQPSKKKKPSKAKKQVDGEVQGVVGDGKPKAAPSKSSKKAPTATTAENSKKPSKQKKRSESRAASVESNKSSGSAKRAKSQDKSQDKSESNNNTKPTSRDSSKSRSRSTSRSRVAEEEAAAAAVVAAAELPEGVPLNQCRRLIAAQKKLISKCLAKKEREQARLAKQEAARAARLAALVRAAEARKVSTGDAGEQDGDAEQDGVEGVAAPAGADAPATLTTVPAAPAGHRQHHGHHGHHNHNHHDDPPVERSRVEELAAQTGLHVPPCLTISQSELRLLESCAEIKAPKWSNGWQWRGTPFLHRVFLNCDDPPVLRKCYPAMQHMEGDNIVLGDTILLKSGTRKIDLPFVARVIHLWENPEDGEMMLSLVWFYRPEHTEQGRRPCDLDDEIFSSRHKDINSVACIEDKCYVLTFNEYCRYRKTIRRLEEGLSPPSLIVPAPEAKYPRHHRLPPGHVAPDMVFFCRKIYDFRQRRLQKNVF